MEIKFALELIIDVLLSFLRMGQHAPNKTSSSEDIMLNVPLVRQQLRGAETIDAIRIHKQGESTTLIIMMRQLVLYSTDYGSRQGCFFHVGGGKNKDKRPCLKMIGYLAQTCISTSVVVHLQYGFYI